MTISEIGRRLRARELSVREVVDETLRAIARENPRLNAFITVTGAAARARADELDDMLAQGVDLGPLHGVPIAHKDCILTRGVRTTAGSKILADWVPNRDAEVVTRLHEAGAVMVGKTGLHEFTYGITNVNPHYGPVRNPWNTERVSGGSSGGSGAAVAAGMVPLATGTDTGGSIRIPASFCGCVGLKPTYGRIGRRGVLPLGPTQDHVGPMTRTVRDSATAYRVMAGLDVHAPLPRGLASIRIGVPGTYFWERLEPDVRASARGAVQVIAALGAKVREVRVPDVDPLTEIARATLLCEAASVLGRHKGSSANFGKDVWALIEKGRAIPAVEYLDAQRERRRQAQEFSRVWGDLDCLITPTTPLAAFPIEHTTVSLGGVTEDPRPAATRLTRPFNLLGWPALSLPCGFSREGLPVGVQLVGSPGAEDVLFEVGSALEDALGLTQQPLRSRPTK